MKRILVACVGNIFLGDDAFGVEVARALSGRALPPEAQVIDFGISSYDLAYALSDGYDAAILVDAAPRGHTPGTLYLMELDMAQVGQLQTASVDAHSMNPVNVLQMLPSLENRPERLYIVGCEPENVDWANGALSKPVRATVPKAIDMIEALVHELVNLESKTTAGCGPA